ncbi:MAG TPA: helix-turn-helix transcriptional regulator, partial [Aggregatilineales bacterium]|nr:helix-turn-helix transcriptional regulator [Aggregatilineales bacterium]
MSFSDIANRFRKQNEAEAAASPQKPPADPQEVLRLRSRITGVLIRDARVAQGYNVEQLAELMQTSSDQVIAWEFGHESPSLPELELLAYWLEVAVSHFMSSTETLVEQIVQRKLDQDEYFKIRNRMIGTRIQNVREQAGFTLEYLAEKVGLDVQTLQHYEFGQLSVPLAQLTSIASTLRININYFLEGRDRVGKYLQAQELFENFLKMDPEVR